MLNDEIEKFLEQALGQRKGTDLADLIEYESFCGKAEGRSPATINLTSLALNKLRRYLQENGLSTDVRMIGPQEIREFILHLRNSRRFAGHPYTKSQDGTLSDQTVNDYLRAVRAAWNRWIDASIVNGSPFDKLKVPKAPRKIIPTFSEGQLAAFFGVIDTSTVEGFRDLVLFLLYLDTMCRLTEVTKARIPYLNLKNRYLKVMGKGSKERLVPLGVTVSKLLWKYVQFYRPEPAIPTWDYLFLTREGRPLTKNRVEARMKRYGEKAGIQGVRCSPHTLRHTACVMWIRNGGDIFSLQRITGHSSLEVLRGYVNLAQGDIMSAHQSHSPIDNLNLRVLAIQRRRNANVPSHVSSLATWSQNR
jgi:integrase/recombinase XerD